MSAANVLKRMFKDAEAEGKDPRHAKAKPKSKRAKTPSLSSVQEPTAAEISRVMSILGRRGGRIGGKRRLETMTEAERSAAGLKAAEARWKNKKR